MDAVDEAQDELYRVPPEDFVAERDARVAAAKENGDKDTAKAIGALRRPSKAAWLVNLLVHDRRDEVEGLLGLAATLASAQRTLDGAALRQMSAQRNKLVGALSRRATQLGREAGHRVDSGLERDVRGILESALADPELAGRVRSGRLVKAERHAGFGPEPDPGTEPRPAPARTPGPDEPETADATPDERESEQRRREIARAEADLDKADRAASEARAAHDSAHATAEGATRRQDEARDRVGDLVEELERAREESAAANRTAHAAARDEKEAARAARTADTARDRAAAALDELRSS